MYNYNNRIQWLDITRCIAISLVILNHSVEEIFIKYLYGNVPTSTSNTIFMCSVFTLGRMGVPLFLFITGALMIKRDYTRTDTIINFYKKYVIPLIVITIIWIFLYNLFNLLFFHRTVSIISIILQLLFLKGNDMPHIWYMYMVIGLYLVLPFMSTIVNSYSDKIIFAVCILLFTYSVLLPSANQFIQIIGFSKTCSTAINLTLLGNCYSLYCLTGHYIPKYKTYFTNSLFIVCTGLFSFLLTVIIQAYSYSNSTPYRVWYDFITLYFSAFCLMVLLSKIHISNTCIISVAEYISRRSLALYFIHMPVRFLLAKYIPFINLNAKFATFAFWITCLSFSCLLIFFLEKNNFCRKWVLLVK